MRYIGASNFAGRQLSKSLAAADRAGGARFISQQIHYTLEAREAEYERLRPRAFVQAPVDRDHASLTLAEGSSEKLQRSGVVHHGVGREVAFGMGALFRSFELED